MTLFLILALFFMFGAGWLTKQRDFAWALLLVLMAAAYTWMGLDLFS